MKKYKFFVFCLIFVSCSGSAINTNSTTIPEWVLKTPFEKGKLYSVGIVGPTFLPEDGLRYSADEARKELAKSLGGRVRSVLLLLSDSQKTTVREVSIVEATAWSTDLVLTRSAILSYWIDENGLVPNGVKMATYALCVISFENIYNGLNQRLSGILNEKQKNDALEELKKSLEKK